MATCAATTHSGARCSAAADASSAGGLCAHHARMARLLALAPKPAAAASSPPPPPQQRRDARPASADAALFSAAAPQLPPQTVMATAPSFAAPAPPRLPSEMIQLPGESVLATVSCSLAFPAAVALPALPGTLFVTSFRLRFEPANAALRSPGHVHQLLDDALVGAPRACVAKLVYPQAVTATRSKYDSAVPTQLVIKFKDLRAWTLGGDVSALMLTLTRHVFLDSPLSLFAFASSSSSSSARELRGHQIYDLHADFARMGVDLAGGPFRVTELNRSYAMCPTYPPQLVVPAAMTDREVASVAAFRSKGRLPICCFVHARNSASIWRCAQPKRGLLNAQSAADDRHLMHMAYSNRQQKRVWIADCRPELNARVNSLTGGGTESASHQHASVSFLNIANIHAMRESLEGVRALVATGNAELDLAWLTRVEDTKWLGHVRLVLSAALRVADAVENKATTVLVHCSDGWDRTGQLCALAQLLLDPHYRTLEGFARVVEKEWVRAGHKFHDRVGPGASESEEQSPVFLQFLDCVWQLWRQFPTYFEFDGRLLECVADATFSGRFGTFLGNCDRERAAWNLSARTQSLWTHVLDHRAAYENPFYRPGATASVLLPPASAVLRQVTLWSEYYFRSSTLPANPTGNPAPPLFGASAAPTAKNNHEDLGFAMTAALRRIRTLEDELREARARVTAASAASALQSAPACVAPPIATSPAPVVASSLPSSPAYVPVAISSSSPPAPSASSASTPDSGLFQLGSLSVSCASSSPPSSLSTWTCGICSKLNVSESAKWSAVYRRVGDRFRARFAPFAGWAHSVLFTGDLAAFQSHLPAEMQRPKKPAAKRTKELVDKPAAAAKKKKRSESEVVEQKKRAARV